MIEDISVIIPAESAADATPKSRAERLRRLRNLANLSRKAMCAGTDININTYIGYEVARYGGLTSIGANRVIERVKREGVECSYDWLMYNLGQPPIVHIDAKAIPAGVLPAFEKSDGQDSVVLIIKELNYFRLLHNNVVYRQVEDDSMFPKYETGEYVAGIKRYGRDIAVGENKDCIVELDNGALYFRHLRRIAHSDQYKMVCLNPYTHLDDLAIQDTQIKSVAPIIWRRKLDS